MTDNTVTIDGPRAVSLLRQVVAERGRDHVYARVPNAFGGTSCVYAHDGAPSCLVGHALQRAGVTVAELDGMAGTILYPDDARLPERFLLTVGAAEAMHAAQLAQDIGNTWGAALDVATGVAGRAAGDDQ